MNLSILNREATEMGQNEKLFSLGAGSFMLVRALFTRSLVKAIPAGYMIYRGLTGKCPVSDLVYKKMDEMDSRSHAVEVNIDITVNKPRKDVYAFWRKLENLPTFMKHLESVEVIDKLNSKWKMQVFENFGKVEWNAEITADQKNELISWQSLPDSQIDNYGQVKFKDAGKFETEVNVLIKYTAPAGMAGEGVAKLLNPVLTGMIKEDLKNFKRIIETGEIPTIEGQSSDRDKD